MANENEAENKRVKAEKGRVIAENGRVLSESHRVTDERNRTKAEIERRKDKNFCAAHSGMVIRIEHLEQSVDKISKKLNALICLVGAALITLCANLLLKII